MNTSVPLATPVVELNHDQFGTECTRLPERFEDRDQITRRGAHLVNGANNVIQRNAFLDFKHGIASLLDVDIRARRDHGAASTCKRTGLTDILTFGNGHGETAMRHCGRQYSDVFADHHRTGACRDFPAWK